MIFDETRIELLEQNTTPPGTDELVLQYNKLLERARNTTKIIKEDGEVRPAEDLEEH